MIGFEGRASPTEHEHLSRGLVATGPRMATPLPPSRGVPGWGSPPPPRTPPGYPRAILGYLHGVAMYDRRSGVKDVIYFDTIRS